MLEKLLRDIGKDISRPFGIFLSGGLDSGILAALLKPDFAISCNFEGEFYDELEYAYAIAEHLEIKPHYIIQPDKDNFKETIKEAMKIIKEPVNSVSIFPWYQIMSAAKDLGAKTMIGGEGADETFGGYSRYLILKTIDNLYGMESLLGYRPMLDSIFESIDSVHSKMIKVPRETLRKRYLEKDGFLNQIGWAELNESLPPVVNMQRKFAKHFDIDLHLPFLNEKVRDYGFSLEDCEKMTIFDDDEFRKIPILEIAQDYLPKKVWQRKDKKGFVCPANEWSGSINKYDKTNYMKMQNEIISNNN